MSTSGSTSRCRSNLQPLVRRALHACTLTAALAIGIPALAAERGDGREAQRPDELAMIGDALVARPIGAVITAAGTAAFLVTLPFSLIGGNVKESGARLVVGPAKETFVRCLGCRSSGRDRGVRNR